MKKIIALIMTLVFVFALTACSGKSADYYDIGNTDRATYFYNQYKRLIDKYGAASFDGDKLQGVAVARLIDFTGDGVYEIYFAYADGTQDYVNRHMIIGFDRGPATIFDEEITSKVKASDATPQIWIYTDAVGRGYIVTGEAMAEVADYSTFITTRDGEKIYKFQKEFTIGGENGDTVELDGTWEKIALTGLTQEDADVIFEENDCVIDSIEGQAE